jgi:hypothetical protein
MSPYSDTTSNNSSPERHGGATSFSTLPTKKSLIVHIKAALITKFCFLEMSKVKDPEDHNCVNSSINGRRQTSIFHPGLLGPGMTIDKNMNSGLIHIPGGKL